jgi:hypothetical protein
MRRTKLFDYQDGISYNFCMPTKADFQTTFEQLKAILKEFEPFLTVKTDAPDNYYLDGPYSPKFKKEIFFGAVQIKKNYISYHLMPVYAFPDLLDGISPALKKRMQGKSCFNFTAVNEELFVELAHLTRLGFDRFRQAREFLLFK